MMLSHAEEIEPDLIGQRALFDDVPERLGLRQLCALVIDRDVSKRVETEFGISAARVQRGRVVFNRLRHLGAVSLEVRSGLPNVANPPGAGRASGAGVGR